MEKKRKRSKLILSPLMMSNKRKMELIKCNNLPASYLDDFNTISKVNQDVKEPPVNSPIIHPTKSLNHLNVYSNLQSTPNTRHFDKPRKDSRTIMNLSPIVSMSSETTNLNSCQDSFQKTCDFSLDQLKSSLSNFNNRQEYDKFDKLLKNKELIKESTNEYQIQNTPILPVNTGEINEKAKRCLFENEKTDSLSNFNTDQDSLNISLDILEQVCQMSEMIDNSSPENIQMSDSTDKKKNKLAFFLYGNDSSTKLDDTKQENELLQLALSMEDNLSAEIKSNNKLSFEGKFTSLNQMKNNKRTLPENDNIQHKNDKLTTYNCDSKYNFSDTEEINDIGNTQMCEIADMTEPLESFDDQWTQQYYTNNSNNECYDSLEITKIVPDVVLKSPINCIDNKFNFKKSDLLGSIGNKEYTKVQLISKYELDNFSTTTNQKTNTSSNLFKGFSTAAGKAIKVSDDALQKAQSMLKDELDSSLISSNDKTITNPNICKGFSTAGGKSIKVSDDALQKARFMLKDELDGSLISYNDKTITNPNVCQGFSTARGKSVKVSDDALQKARFMLKVEQDSSLISSNDKTITNPNICKGFSTAGGKSIKVSDDALQKARFMLKDELDGSLISSNDKTITNPNICKGFSTAGGKSIKVSDKTLQKVQSMLKDELDGSLISSNDKTITNTNICKRFSTAGGKSVKVSDRVLKKVQSTFKNELNSFSTSTYKKTIISPSVCKGFSTALGKSVKVSDTAIQKVELMLKDDLSGIELFNDSLKTMDETTDNNNTDERLNNPKLVVKSNSKSQFLDIFKNDEECALEDLSLIDTIEKFERDQIECKATFRNKRPGSPTYEINHTFKRTVPDEKWENDALKTSFDVYLSKKLNGPKVLLPEVVDWIRPKTQNLKVPKYGSNIKSNTENAFNLKLHWNNKLFDGNRNKIYNFQDIKTFFLSHHFVDVKLVPKRWIENHFYLIVWKLAATEKSFPNYFENKLLTAENVLHQLLFRYYREIEKCQRSALKKVLEKDESATKRIVLCVSKVTKTNITETYNVELTDGWYSVQGLIDFEMNVLLHKGIVKVGTKLMIYNAELIGAREGIDPLDVHDGIKLKISTNSTRRVRWYTKLGFYKNASLPIPITLESVLPRGGAIGSLSLVILRKYPMMYFERKINSKSVLRNEKAEAIEAEKYEAYKQKSLEIISNKVETELISEMASTNKKSEKCFLRIKKENVDELSIEELSNMIENSIDPLEIQSLLSQEKLDAVNNFKKSEQERFYNELQKRVNQIFNDQFKDARKVIPLFKLRVVDEQNASTGLKSAILTIWNPSEDLSTILNKSCEGQYCKLHHLTTNGFKNGELQISANKNTRFDFQGFKSEYAKREVINFKNILSGNYLPLFGELDFVGIVISNINKNNNFSNEIYVSDTEMNIISILFQGDIKEYGCDDLMSPGNIIFAANILFKGFNSISSILKLYNTEQSSFTTIPKAEHILKMFNDYKIFMKKSENQDFIKCCQSKLNEIGNINMEITKTSNDDSKQQCLNTSNNSFHRSYGECSMTVMKTPNTSHSEYSPAQKRIKMLNNYGRPPPLNIIHSKPPDKKLMSQFKTPTRL